jgi:hypothetical protein
MVKEEVAVVKEEVAVVIEEVAVMAVEEDVVVNTLVLSVPTRWLSLRTMKEKNILKSRRTVRIK